MNLDHLSDAERTKLLDSLRNFLHGYVDMDHVWSDTEMVSLHTLVSWYHDYQKDEAEIAFALGKWHREGDSYADSIKRLRKQLRTAQKRLKTTEAVKAKAEPEPTEEEWFYIQNNSSYAYDYILWWRPNSRGYTYALDAAGKYTRQQAEAIVRSRPDQEVMWPVSQVDAATNLAVSIESLRR